MSSRTDRYDADAADLESRLRLLQPSVLWHVKRYSELPPSMAGDDLRLPGELYVTLAPGTVVVMMDMEILHREDVLRYRAAALAKMWTEQATHV